MVLLIYIWKAIGCFQILFWEKLAQSFWSSPRIMLDHPRDDNDGEDEEDEEDGEDDEDADDEETLPSQS